MGLGYPSGEWEDLEIKFRLMARTLPPHLSHEATIASLDIEALLSAVTSLCQRMTIPKEEESFTRAILQHLRLK